MQSSLTTFLIKCDKDGQIIEVYWHQPAYLISPFQKHLSDIFAEADLILIHELIRQAVETKDVLACQRKLSLRNPQTSISVCFMAVENQILVMGLDASFLDQEESSYKIKYVINEFMKLIRVSDHNLTGKSEKTIRFQFEQIQKLNNKLINAQRELSKANAELNRLNSYLNNRLVKDELTGLVSRYQYRAEIELYINEQPDKLGIFVFIDIDHFKQINDSYGHRTGDTYLQIFSRRLQKINPSDKICMRISGDEFGLYLHGFTSVEDADMQRIWNEIETKVIAEPAIIDDISVRFRCSAGMAIFGLDTREIYDLIEYADFAMYQAKKMGKNQYQRFDMSLYRKEKG
jgi:diguanylate cyclase (GGDEF)-like protein